MLVFISVVNRGTEPLSLKPSDFALYDNYQRRYSAHGEATKLAAQAYDRADLFAEAVEPGLSRQGILTFDVPQEDASFSLRLFNGFMDVSLGS